MQGEDPSPHIARPATAQFRAHFTDEKVVSKGFKTECPPRSSDVNTCGFNSLLIFNSP